MKNFIIGFIRNIKRKISQTATGEKIATKIQRVIFKILFRHSKGLFTYYYKTNKWGNSESVSGSGSTINATKTIRFEIPKLIREYEIRTILDAPCGDYNWFRLLTLDPEIEYTGGDIVEELVLNNKKNYEHAKRKFVKLDIINDKIPTSDLWLCRDVLIHLSNKDATEVIFNLKNSRIKYFLSTTFPDIKENCDIHTGEYHAVNLEIPPFNFPSPLKYIDDSDAELKGKKLGFWRLN
jgi:hypothetical protein